MDHFLEKFNPIIAELKQDFDTISMPRSPYVLENLVVKVHEHPTEQWRQCVLELRAKYFNIRRALVRQQILQQELQAEQDSLQAELKRIDLEELEYTLAGYIREFESLYRIYKQFPRFSREQMDDAQMEYWQRRLLKQAQQDINAFGRVSVGNQEGLRQIGVNVVVNEPLNERTRSTAQAKITAG